MAREQYQTVKEIADRLMVSEATVRGWIKTGELRAITIGKGWRVADSDLSRFLCRHETRTRASVPEASASRKKDDLDEEHGE
ncbi:helix-turn-helix domain-containing protein [Roseivivax sediminis]|uniref:helix-turn-helix domain-containing protein n=1 Tax=Roseivivax sediminis TaxID=936889 RepID=UPI00122C9A12|nr:helix-turn-helix domain-containing protein [Roseivivax sediminis]